MNNKIEKINQNIDRLKKQLEEVQGTKTEVYTRIVGYYRSVKNWNKGKREEYGIRTTFKSKIMNIDDPAIHSRKENMQEAFEFDSTDYGSVNSYIYFFRSSCPNCPPVRALLPELQIEGREMNVDSEEGFELAQRYCIASSPTVVFLDKNANEVSRAVNPQEIREHSRLCVTAS